MQYFLSEQQQLIKSLARRIAEERILPVRQELDEKEEFPWALVKDLADADKGQAKALHFPAVGWVLLSRERAGYRLTRMPKGVTLESEVDAREGEALRTPPASL